MIQNIYNQIETFLTTTTKPSNGIIVYSNANYTGKSVTLPVGSYDINAMVKLGISNDSITSIKVPAGFYATAYIDKTPPITGNNAKLDIKNDIPDLSTLTWKARSGRKGNWNNKISLMVVGKGKLPLLVKPKVLNPKAYVILYDQPNYQGKSYKVYVGEYDMEALDNIGIANDGLQSIQIPNGSSATLYAANKGDGFSFTITNDIPDFTPFQFRDGENNIVDWASKTSALDVISVPLTKAPTTKKAHFQNVDGLDQSYFNQEMIFLIIIQIIIISLFIAYVNCKK